MNDRVKVRIQTASEPLVSWVSRGQTVWDAIQQAGIVQRGDCGGRGICLKCKARLEGEVSPPTSEEISALSSEEVSQGYRLTCKCHVLGETTVFLPEVRIANCKTGLLMYERYPGVLSAVRPVNTHIPPFDRGKPIPLLERIEWAFKGYKLEITPSNLNIIAKLDQGDGFRVVGGLIDSTVLRIHPRGQNSFCGLALDIGTTSLSCALIDLVNGELLGEGTRPNSQIAYGRDILARISYVMENERGLKLMQDKVMRDIASMVDGLLDRLDIAHEDILEMIVVGNPVMLHLFMGVDPRGLGQAPYVGLFRDTTVVRACSLGMPMHPAGRVLFLPQIAGFLGSDIIACLLAVDDSSPESFLLIDIGTNGEMALKHKDRLVACSVAAGSAFEGGDITSGMVACTGAIDRFWLVDGKLNYNVIGIDKPDGICGSGMIDLLNVLLEMGVLDETGLINPGRYYGAWRDTERGVELIIVDETKTASGVPVVFNQQDVRQLQLAKGAVRAGIDILMKEVGVVPENIDEVMFAGAFGNYVNPNSVMGIGMIPHFQPGKIKAIGNAALRGAIAALILIPEREKAQRYADEVIAVELADHPDFSRVFVDSMTLK
ncbi:MAG: ASKHA domain-containing protein [Bacillota bacterium]